MTFLFYDTETTGLVPAFDQILQFAAIVTDDDFRVLDQLNIRCRLLPHVLPSPGAMAVTGVGPKAIQGASHSCYEMTGHIRKFIEKWSPAVLVGFNSIAYDENMLRQAFYQQLHPVYLTNTKGNSRLDILKLAHAVATWRPEAITVPLNEKGRPSFRLGLLMEANALPMGAAHDAFADTQATLDLARFLRQAAPDVWDDVFSCRSRTLVAERLEEVGLVCFTDRMFKKPTIVGGVICTSPGNPALYALFDLEYDPQPWLETDAAGAVRLLKANPRPVRLLRANNLPILRRWDPEAFPIVDRRTAVTRLEMIRNSPGFALAISEALAGQWEDGEPSEHIEDHIYAGFPDRPDQILMERFHRAPWSDRYELCQKFSDPKYRKFGERLIFAEYPAGLPEEKRLELQRWCEERHLTKEECRWMTRHKAMDEITRLRATGADHALLEEISAYFTS